MPRPKHVIPLRRARDATAPHHIILCRSGELPLFFCKRAAYEDPCCGISCPFQALQPR